MPNKNQRNRHHPKQTKGSIAKLARRGEPGAIPGTLLAKPDATDLVINAIVYDGTTLVEKQNCPVSSLADIDRENKTLWLDVCGLASADAIETIGKLFGLHRLALEDVLNAHQRPKVEEFDEFLFIVMRMPDVNATSDTEQFAMFLGSDFLLTFQEHPGDCLNPIRERLRKNKGRVRKNGADYLAYALIDTIVDSYYPVLEAYGEKLEELEDLVISSPTPAIVHQLHVLRRDVLTMRRSVWPLRDALNALVRDESQFIRDNSRIYLRDCYDHVIQLIDIVETYREIAAGVLEIYLSSVSTRMNEVMKILTIIATIFIPLSFVTGIFGMNFDRAASPFNQPELAWRFGYPLALGLMAVVAGGLVYFFWRKGWIWDRSSRSL